MTTPSTTNSRIINAPAETLYNAATNAEALATWLAPGEMTGKVQHFDLRVGGGYEMSLFYPESEKAAKGKTNAKEDRFTARFVALTPFKRIVEAINFHSDDPGFAGEMTMEITFEPVAKGTKVTFTFTNIPPGIKPEDNEKGTELTLEKLAKYVE